MSKCIYNNPPIDEAICIFTFAQPVEGDLHFLTLLGKLQERLEDDEYDGVPIEQRIRNADIQENEISSKVIFSDSLNRVQLPNKEKTRLVALGSDSLSISMMCPYGGWDEEFLPRIQRALEAYMDIAGSPSVEHVAVRYLNRIVIDGANANPSLYFTNHSDNDIMSSHFHAALMGFKNSYQYFTNDKYQVTFTHATLVPDNEDQTEFLLDIEVSNKVITSLKNDDIIELTKKLHTLESKIFEKLITDKTREAFKNV